MKRTNLIILLAIFIIVSATTGCKKDDDSNIVSVTEASWYFGTWKEQGSSNLLQLSRTDVVFSLSSDLQHYGSSLTWYDAGDEGADVFFGYNTAGGYFQATEGNNPIPNPYYFNHEGELLTITTASNQYSETVVKRLTRESSTPTGEVTGNWVRSDGASYLKFSGSSIYLCNGTSLQEFSGTYDASAFEATLIEGSTILTFKIYPDLEDKNKILIEQYVSNEHISSTYYYKSTEYPCEGETAKTKVIFWNSQGYHSAWGWQVCIDGDGFPNCSSNGGSVENGLASSYPDDCVNYSGAVEVTPGYHTYDVVGQNRYWAIQSFTISEGQCLIVDVGVSEN